MLLSKKARVSLFILLVSCSCSTNKHTYLQEVLIGNHQIDSVINYALKEESEYIDIGDSVCGIMRFSRSNNIFQLEIVITDK